MYTTGLTVLQCLFSPLLKNEKGLAALVRKEQGLLELICSFVRTLVLGSSYCPGLSDFGSFVLSSAWLCLSCLVGRFIVARSNCIKSINNGQR